MTELSTKFATYKMIYKDLSVDQMCDYTMDNDEYKSIIKSISHKSEFIQLKSGDMIKRTSIQVFKKIGFKEMQEIIRKHQTNSFPCTIKCQFFDEWHECKSEDHDPCMEIGCTNKKYNLWVKDNPKRAQFWSTKLRETKENIYKKTNIKPTNAEIAKKIIKDYIN